jgi:[ribosomal protein S5]-alanine N-acetyltransferase
MEIELEPPTERREEDFLRAVRRSRKLHRHRVTPPSTPTKYRQYLEHSRGPRNKNFLVIAKDDDAVVGVVNIEQIVWGYFKSAFLGYYAFEPYAGRGLMREALRRVIDLGFRQLKLHRLEANIQPTNERSIALVKSFGFRLEGLSKGYLKISGHWRDHERWAILADEWFSNQKGR